MIRSGASAGYSVLRIDDNENSETSEEEASEEPIVRNDGYDDCRDVDRFIGEIRSGGASADSHGLNFSSAEKKPDNNSRSKSNDKHILYSLYIYLFIQLHRLYIYDLIK